MRFVRIFLKYLLKYFWGFITVFLCGFLSVTIMEGRIEKMLVEQAKASSKSGLHRIQTGIAQMDAISRMVYQDNRFEELMLVRGKSTGQEVVYLKDMNEELSEIDILVNEFVYLFNIFPENDLFLSSDQCSLYFEEYYGKYLEIELEGIKIQSAQELKEKLIQYYMEGRHFVRLDSMRYMQTGELKTLQNAVLYLKYDNEYTRMEPEYLLCFVMDYDWLIECIVLDNITEEDGGFFSVKSNDGTYEILSYGLAEQGISEDYYLLQEEMPEIDWQLTMGLSRDSLKQMVSSSREFVLIYVCSGLLIVLLLTCYYSFKRYFDFRNVMSLFPESLGGLLEKGHDEYAMMQNRVKKLLESGEDDRKIINELKVQNQAIMLEHLIVNGIKSPKEREIVEKYFEKEPEFFCVVLAELGTEEITLQEDIILYMVTYLDMNDIPLLLQVHTGVSGEIFLIEVVGQQAANTGEIKNVFQRLNTDISERYQVSLHIGISAIGVGIQNMNRCYEQARQLVSAQNVYEGESVTEAYDISVNTLYDNPIDLEFLNRLHTLLLCGQKDDIYKALDKIEGFYIRMPYQYEQQKEQIFYSLRNIFHIAVLQLSCKDIKELSDFDAQLSCRQLFHMFRCSAEQICNHVLGKRKSRNEELKENILSYMKENYQNPDLSAGMVCQDIGIAEKYLFQFLKEQTGETFAAMLLHLRIEAAKRYLRETDCSNEQIAAMSGFSSVNTFYRNFKKIVGVTPNVFKEGSR